MMDSVLRMLAFGAFVLVAIAIAAFLGSIDGRCIRWSHDGTGHAVCVGEAKR